MKFKTIILFVIIFILCVPCIGTEPQDEIIFSKVIDNNISLIAYRTTDYQYYDANGKIPGNIFKVFSHKLFLIKKGNDGKVEKLLLWEENKRRPVQSTEPEKDYLITIYDAVINQRDLYFLYKEEVLYLEKIPLNIPKKSDRIIIFEESEASYRRISTASLLRKGISLKISINLTNTQEVIWEKTFKEIDALMKKSE